MTDAPPTIVEVERTIMTTSTTIWSFLVYHRVPVGDSSLLLLLLFVPFQKENVEFDHDSIYPLDNS
jgi:hypothetical protein